MNLTEKPELIARTKSHYVYLEKIGPFQTTAPQAWQELHQLVPSIAKANKITGYLSLYKVGSLHIYRAGVTVVEKHLPLPHGLQCTEIEAGNYLKFTLKGSYANLPQACGRVAQIVQEQNMAVRQEFFIENYVNDPRTTPEEQLVTEILIPTLEVRPRKGGKLLIENNVFVIFYK